VKAKELRELEPAELDVRLKERGDALRNFRLQMATASVENSRAARNARRDVARIMTIKRERELSAQKKAK
jgi:large subunit ribosomal protein L29